MIYGSVGDIIKVERIKFADGSIDPREYHYGIIIANEIDLCTFLLMTHKTPYKEGSYFFLPKNEFRNSLFKKKRVDSYVRFKEEFETDKNLEVIGKIKRDEVVINLLKAYRKYLKSHEQVIVNVGSEEESVHIKKL